MEQKDAKSEKLSQEIARNVRQRIKKRNKEIKLAVEEGKKMMETDTLHSDNEIEEDDHRACKPYDSAIFDSNRSIHQGSR